MEPQSRFVRIKNVFSDNTREVCLLFVALMLATIGIYVIVINNKNEDRIMPSYFKYQDATDSQNDHSESTIPDSLTRSEDNGETSDGSGEIKLNINLQAIPGEEVQDQDAPRVNTTSGQLTGLSRSFRENKLHVFLGVPYAKAPIGPLRFAKTAAVSDRSRQVNCTSFKPHCLQDPAILMAPFRVPLTDVMSEDCLYLNIWAPKITSEQARKSIMIWFFGGGFQGGTNNLDEFDGRVLAALGDVIVVTVNYRNGPLGYLDLMNPSIPGNQGIHDMVAAITWVRKNAFSFNGDPSSITLFGHSSGSMSISLLMANNDVAKMFRRVILQSGSALIPGKMFRRTFSTGLYFASKMNCSKGNSEETVACIKQISSEKLLEFIPSNLNKYRFAPGAGLEFDNLIPVLPEDVLIKSEARVKSGEYYSQVNEVMMGVTSNESSVMFMFDFPDEFTPSKVRVQFNTSDALEQFLENSLTKKYGISEEHAFVISNLFFKDMHSSKPEQLLSKLLQVASDLMFVCPSTVFAKKLTSNVRSSKLYFYQFDRRPPFSPFGEWMGVVHGDENAYIFGLPLRYPNRYVSDDMEISKFMVGAWTSFAKTGIPMARSVNNAWPRFLNSSQRFLKIKSLNSHEAKVQSRISADICTDFERIYDKLMY